MKLLNKINEMAWNFRSKYASIPEYDFEYGEVVRHYTPIIWDRQSLVNLVLSGIAGAILGVVVALAVNTALVELTVSSAFCLYFGLVFVLVGIVIGWRILRISSVPHPDDSAASRTPRRYLLMLSGLIILSGTLCCFFEPNTLLALSPLPRCVLYSLFGMTASFALIFGIVDLLNLLVGVFRSQVARPLVESVLQIYIVVLTAIGMGALFGGLFSLVNSATPNTLVAISLVARAAGDHSVQMANFIDPQVCTSIGVVWGGIAGVANEYIRRLEMSFNKLDQSVEFECDI